MGPSARHEELAARALEHPQRARLLEALRSAPGGLGVGELAAQAGLHPNTIRWHLRALADAGLVRSETAHCGRAGRPALVYELAVPAGRGDGEGYRFLAELLASALSAHRDGVEQARAAGRAWGGHLVEAPPPFTRIEPGQALERMRGLLEEHGFAPRVTADGIEMHRCPFEDVVADYGDDVCALHEGLLQGALERLGGSIQIERVVPWARPGVCTAAVAVR